MRVALTGIDYERAVKFYCQGLGLEAGKRVSGQIHFVLQAPDLKAAMERLLAHGAILVHPPVVTPRGKHNVSLQEPDFMQITLFQAADYYGWRGISFIMNGTRKQEYKDEIKYQTIS